MDFSDRLYFLAHFANEHPRDQPPYYHCVARDRVRPSCVNTDRTKTWSDFEVVECWNPLFNITKLSRMYLKNEGQLLKVEMLIFQLIIDEWGSRLLDISWFMGILNEAIAREGIPKMVLSLRAA